MDFDGTVVDTMKEYARAASELLSRRLGLDPEVARRLYEATAGMAFRDQLKLMGVDEDKIESLAREFEEWKKGLLATLRLDRKVASFIERLRKAGLKVYLSTNNECNVVLESPGLVEPFDGVLCYDKSRGLKKGRPHVEEVARREGVTPEEILFIGDSEYDLNLYSKLGVRVMRTRGLWIDADAIEEEVMKTACTHNAH